MPGIYDSELHRLDPYIICEKAPAKAIFLTAFGPAGPTVGMDLIPIKDHPCRKGRHQPPLQAVQRKMPQIFDHFSSSQIQEALEYAMDPKKLPFAITWQCGRKHTCDGSTSRADLFLSLLRQDPVCIYPELSGIKAIYEPVEHNSISSLDGIPLDIENYQQALVEPFCTGSSDLGSNKTLCQVRIGGICFDVDKDRHGQSISTDAIVSGERKAERPDQVEAMVESRIRVLSILEGRDRCFDALPFGQHENGTIWLIGLPTWISGGPIYDFMETPELTMTIDGKTWEPVGPPRWEPEREVDQSSSPSRAATTIMLMWTKCISEGQE